MSQEYSSSFWPKIGALVMFTKDIYSNVGHNLIVPANTACRVEHINNSAIRVFVFKTNKVEVVRNMPDRMVRYSNTEMGKFLYG